MIALTLSLLMAPALACPEALPPEALDAELEAAFTAWSTVDEPGFLASVQRLQDGVPCLAAPLTPAQAARLHRVLGIARAGASEADTAALHFAAARVADPTLSWSLPKGHPMSRLYGSVDLGAPRVALPPPPEGRLVVDGAATAERVEAWPAVVQWVVDEELRRSELLAPGLAPSAWPEPVVVEVDPVLPPDPIPVEPPPEGRELPVLRLAATGGAAALAGGFALGSAVMAGRYDDAVAARELAAAPGARRGANTLGLLAVGSAAAAAGLGATLVIDF